MLFVATLITAPAASALDEATLAPARAANAPANAPDMAAGVRKISEDPQFSNVKVGDLNVGPAEKVDVAWTSLNYHDLHNRPNADLAAFNKQVFDDHRKKEEDV